MSPWSAVRSNLRAGIGPLLLALIAVGVLASGRQVWIYQLGLVTVYAIIAVGQQWLIGQNGQASIGAAAFTGIGAFTGGAVVQHSWSFFPLPLLFAAVFGAAAGLIVGLTSTRLSGLYLLLSTLALQFIITFAMLEYQGTGGGLFVNAPRIGGLKFDTARKFDYLALAILLISVILLRNLYRSAPGRAWSAIRQNEQAASVTGVHLTRWKLTAFVGSSAITAIGGAMYAYELQTVSYQGFSLDLAISVLVMVYVGGQFSLAGVILGAAGVTLLPYGLTSLQNSVSNASVANWLTTNGPQVDSAVYGVALVLILLVERDGIAGLLATGRDKLIRLFSRGESGTSTPAAPTVAPATAEGAAS